MSEPAPLRPLYGAPTWATLEDVREDWSDAPLDDDRLQRKLDTAHEQCLAYAPVLAADAPVPAGYVEAEIVQTRENWNAGQREGDVIGYGDGFAIRVRPLGQDVKSMLRPRRGRPVVR